VTEVGKGIQGPLENHQGLAVFLVSGFRLKASEQTEPGIAGKICALQEWKCSLKEKRSSLVELTTAWPMLKFRGIKFSDNDNCCSANTISSRCIYNPG